MWLFFCHIVTCGLRYNNQYICNVLTDEDAFAPEASVLLESMVQNQLLQAQILTHEEDGVPYIQLYKIQGDKVLL